jgi:hypothetical protein
MVTLQSKPNTSTNQTNQILYHINMSNPASASTATEAGKLFWAALPPTAFTQGKLSTEFSDGKTAFKQLDRKGDTVALEAVTNGGPAKYAVINIVKESGDREWYCLYGLAFKTADAALAAIGSTSDESNS